MYPWLEDKPVKFKTNNFRGDLFTFQNKGALFLAKIKNCLLTDDTGLGKTIQLIAAYDVLKTKHPDLKIIIVTLRSTQKQWADEFRKFLPTSMVLPVIGNPSSRRKIYKSFYQGHLDGIIIHYGQLRFDLVNKIKEIDKYVFTGPLAHAIKGKNFLLTFDEIQKCKNVSSYTSKFSKWLANQAKYVKGLTATPVYNQLVDIYGIFKLINDKVFKTKALFKKSFCKLNYNFSIYGTICGYKNVDRLKKKIQYYTFGRQKSQVEIDLPMLIKKEYRVELSKSHREMYEKLEEGIDLTTQEKKPIIGALVDAQVCANNLENVKGYSGKQSHPKLDEAERIIREELWGNKLLVFSKFTKTLESLNKKLKGIPVFKVTGKQNINERKDNIHDWEHSPGTSVLLISTAGGAGLNLQPAKAIIWIDRPWSIGEVQQIRGRNHRINSPHSSLLEIHLIVEETIDEYVLETIKEKLEKAEDVFGEIDKPISIADIMRNRDKCRNSLTKSKKPLKTVNDVKTKDMLPDQMVLGNSASVTQT